VGQQTKVNTPGVKGAFQFGGESFVI